MSYSSPYGIEASSVVSNANKRTQSEIANGTGSRIIEGDEKRQRIGESIPQVVQSIEEDEFARMLAEASSTAERQYSSAYTSLGQKSAVQGVDASTSPTIPVDSSKYWSDPHQYTRVMSLPMLETSTIPVLAAFSQNSFEEAINMQIQPVSTELGQAFEAQKALFEQTKKIYSRDNAFLIADDLHITNEEHRNTIRLANLATFVSSVFGPQDVGFYELNDAFVSTFTRESETLQKEPADLFLNLKTQTFLTAVSQEEQEKTKEEHLDDLFPTDYSKALLARHPDVALSPGELEFLNTMHDRREFLRVEAEDVESISALSAKYTWEGFLRDLRQHLKNAYEKPLIEPYMKKHGLDLSAALIPSKPMKQEDDELDLSFLEQATEMAQQAALKSFTSYSPKHANGSQYISQHPPQHGQAGYRPQQFQQGHSSGAASASVPYPTQTAPTQVLYEQARQASVAKSTPQSRRPGLPSQRRPWSTEEENALMAGLDSVKGPHWSQILALYGPKGSISEVLKDRNQVQLKDKARNLKLFFLKSSIEVPYYLQSVTGELKTRAPTQAARREAEERGGSDNNQGSSVIGPSSPSGNSPASGTTNGSMLHIAPKADGRPDVSAQDLNAEAHLTPAEGEDEIDFQKTLEDALQEHEYQERQDGALMQGSHKGSAA